MYAMFEILLNMSLTASVLAIIVILFRIVLKKLPRKYVCILWAFVALRLVWPFCISSSLSAYNLLDTGMDTTGQVNYFHYNEKKEKPELMFDLPVFVKDDMSPNSMTIATHTSDLYLPTVLYIWIFGIAVMLVYAGISYLNLKKQTQAAVLCKEKIYVCEDIPSPCILGVIQPRIYLPSGLDESTKKNVIAHEQAHLKRHDQWWKPLGYILLCIHWFNPVLWLAYILFCRDIEAACDEKAVKDMDRERIAEYAAAMLSCAVQHRWILTCPLAFGETDVKGRVKNVLNYKEPTFRIIFIAMTVCVGIAVCFLTNPQKELSIKKLLDNGYRVTAANGQDEVLKMILSNDERSSFFQLDACLSAEQQKQSIELDSFKENYDQELQNFLLSLEQIKIRDISDLIPAQDDLDVYAGKTIGELTENGFERAGWEGSDHRYSFIYSNAVYECRVTVEDAADIKDPELLQEDEISAMIIESVTFKDLSWNVIG